MAEKRSVDKKREVAQLHVCIRRELKRDAKIYAAEHEIDLRELVESALSNHLKAAGR